MWRARVFLLVAVVSTASLTALAISPGPVFFGFGDNATRWAVERAAEGAAARLAGGECQKVLSDFTDALGEKLSARLEASGTTPGDAFDLLRFYDDRGASQCRAGETLAFTQVGSRLIRICGRQFKDRFARDPAMVEIIVIHEFLHALGLGENPPTSAAITAQVTARCGN